MHNFLPWTASCCVLMWLTGGIAAFAQSGQSLVEKVRGNAEFLRFVGSLNLNGCIEDIPAPDLLTEPRFTQGASNRICFVLPPANSLPVPANRIKKPFVITLVSEEGSNEVLSFPRPVNLADESVQIEVVTGLVDGQTYSYTIALFLPVCLVDCDAVVDSSELELHCSTYDDTVRSTQDSAPPAITGVQIPELAAAQFPSWWNQSTFSVLADLQDAAGVWRGTLLRQDSPAVVWNVVTDSTLEGELTGTGYLFSENATASFAQDVPDGSYNFRLASTDATHTLESCSPDFVLAGNSGEGAESVTINIDTRPPQSVDLTCGQSTNTIRLQWTSSRDFSGIGLAGYRVLKDGALIASLTATDATFDDPIPAGTPDRVFLYQIQPFDSLGNVQTSGGGASCPFVSVPQIVMLPEPEFTAGDSNRVRWHDSDKIDVYTVFIADNGDFANAQSSDIADTSLTFTNLADGVSYSYWVEAFDQQQRPVLSDTVRSIQDGSVPVINVFDVKSKISAGGRNWVNARDIELEFHALDSSPGKLLRLHLFENERLVRSLDIEPPRPSFSAVIPYTLAASACQQVKIAAGVLDAAGNLSDSFVIDLWLDDAPPDSVTELICSQMARGNGIELRWQAVADAPGCSGLAGYRIVRDGSAIAEVPSNVLQYQDIFSEETPSGQFSYQIQPFDFVANVQIRGGNSVCEYVGVSRITMQALPEFTPDLSNRICWTITGSLVSMQVFLDLDCDAVADDSVLVSAFTGQEMCQIFAGLEDGVEYCFWAAGRDGQDRNVTSNVVSSTQDNSAPAIASFAYPDGEPLNGELWAFSRRVDLHLAATDASNGEIWMYTIREDAFLPQEHAFSDSLSQVSEILPYEIQSATSGAARVTLSITVTDGAGNESEPARLTLFVQAELPKMFAFPNPFNPMENAVTIRLHDADETEVGIYDFFGNLVRKLDAKVNTRDFVWDGRNGMGEYVANGGYICIGRKTHARFKIGVTKKR